MIDLGSAIGELPAKIRAAITGMFSAIPGPGEIGSGERGKGWFGHGGLGTKPGVDGMRMPAMPGKQSSLTIHNHTYLDGKQVAYSVERHLVDQHQYPTRAPGGDGFAMPAYG